MSDPGNDPLPGRQTAATSPRRSRSTSSSRPGGWLVSALCFGLVGILLVAFETQATCFGGRPACGLGNPPCVPGHPTTIPCGPTVDHPFAWLGALLIACAVSCLIYCVIAWRRSR